MEYKSLRYIKNVVNTLPMPLEGKILQMGVDDGNALRHLCKMYGSERVVGFDIDPKISHPRLVKFDLWNLDSIHFDIAFCDIDPGDYDIDWKLRLFCLKWAAIRTVKGGMILTQSPMVTEEHWGLFGIDYLKFLNFRCLEFDIYKDQQWFKEMIDINIWNPLASCLYIKE